MLARWRSRRASGHRTLAKGVFTGPQVPGLVQCLGPELVRCVGRAPDDSLSPSLPRLSFALSPETWCLPCRQHTHKGCAQTSILPCKRWGLHAVSMAKKGGGGAGKKKSPKVRADALLVERGLAAVALANLLCCSFEYDRAV